MTQLYKIDVNLTNGQKEKLARAFHKRETIILRLKSSALSGSDTLHVPANVVKKLQKNRQLNKGMEIKLTKTNIRKQVGGNLLSSILTLGRTLAPTLGKTLGLSALAGLASEGASQIVKKISGSGTNGGYIVKLKDIEKLIPHEKELTKKQKEDILKTLSEGKDVVIKTTKTQTGGLLGTILAIISVPLAVEAIKKLTGSGTSGKGAPRVGRPKSGKGAPRIGPPDMKGGRAPRIGAPNLDAIYQQPPPFIGTWEQAMGNQLGSGKKKKFSRKRIVVRKKQPIQFNSNSRINTLKKPKFFKNKPLSNFELLE